MQHRLSNSERAGPSILRETRRAADTRLRKPLAGFAPPGTRQLQCKAIRIFAALFGCSQTAYNSLCLVLWDGSVFDRLSVMSQYLMPKQAMTALAGKIAGARGGRATT